MAIDFDFRYFDVRTISTLDQLLRGLATRFDNLSCIASQKNLANRLLILGRLRMRKMPR